MAASESKLKDFECPVCLDTVSIPVRVQRRVFDCECAMSYVMCLVCARDYFHLNESPDVRPVVKCLLCSKKARCYLGSARAIYEHDAFVSRLMVGNKIQTTCRRCDAKFCTSNEARRHLNEECPNSFTSCEFCKERVLRKDLQLHMDNECLWSHRCLACGDRVDRDSIEAHYDYYCPKITKPCRGCGKLFDWDGMKAHMDICPERVIPA